MAVSPGKSFVRRWLCQSLLAAGSLAVSAAAAAQTVAITDARLIDGLGNEPVYPATLVIENGRIAAVGPADQVSIPAGARRHSINGNTLMPGLINAHGHAGDVKGLETGHYSEENLLEQLSLYASYGITTVVSLGDDEEEGFQLRDAQNTPELKRSRIYVAGPVLNPRSRDDAISQVDNAAAMDPDFIKIRVDDNLGRTPKLAPELYRVVSERADFHNIPLAVHIFYLDDVKDLLRAGADYIAHSVRDQAVDDEMIQLMRARDICYTPTLTREISTFIYESEPEFFSDPFFLAMADPQVIATLREPERQRRMAQSETAQGYKAALPVATGNLKRLSDAGVRIAMGTDSGPPARFQGYFEHLEMWMMQDAGLTPMQIIKSATSDAAACMNIQDTGTLEVGKWADLLVLSEDPLADIRNTRSISEVWIAGNQLERPRF